MENRDSAIAALFAVATLAAAAMPAAAANVKITPLGSHDGEFCRFDRALVLEDPDGTRILYDAGRTVAGPNDPRLGKIDAVILSHVHGDHLGDRHIAAVNDGSCAKPAFPTLAVPNSNSVNIVMAKNARFLVGGGTALGGALTYAARQFERNPFAGRRKVIDISGDGRTNQGAHPSSIRDKAVAAGITINGLAILNEVPDLESYYRSHVIAGTEAFAVSVESYEDFAAAMIRKLLREIRHQPKVSAPPPSQPRLAGRD